MRKSSLATPADIARARRRTAKRLLVAAAMLLAGCEVWFPLPPTADEAERGLVRMYPGSFNTSSEMIGFYYGLQEAGIDQAVEVVKWATFLDHMIDPVGAQVRIEESAAQEALRIAAYKQAHPGRPVTLLGYSGGCWFATRVAERMLPGVQVDRIILLSAAFDRSHDMTRALAGTRLDIVNFWSPKDQFTINVRDLFNLADSTRAEPAATFGLDHQDPRLIQITYNPAWAELGHYGEHTDYVLLVGWIAKFVAPWVAPSD